MSSNPSLTSFLVSQRLILEAGSSSRPKLLSHYRHLKDLQEVNEFFCSFEIDKPVRSKVLIASTPSNSTKLSFVELGLVDSSKVDLEMLKSEWGNYTISDQRERDNIVAVVFNNLSSSTLKRIELISRNEIEDNDDAAFIEAAKFIFNP